MQDFSNISKLDYKLLEKKYPDNLDKILEKLNNNYPVQYLIGNVNFYGYQINVDERVLIPRFETEGLVEKTIQLIKSYKMDLNIIDICTGSGCIAIALSKELNTKVSALDISKSALELAKVNAINNQADVDFIQGDISDCQIKKNYDILISNPPYVDPKESVDPRTKHEPQNAIFAPDNGLFFYKTIIKKSREFLNKKNILAFEIGYNQAEEIKEIVKKYYPKSKIILKKDLCEKNRYIFIIND